MATAQRAIESTDENYCARPTDGPYDQLDGERNMVARGRAKDQQPLARTNMQMHAVTIEATTRRRHLTGMTAMNIPQRWSYGGDWHTGSWFTEQDHRVPTTEYTDDNTYAAIADRLGDHGVCDARWGLRRLGHPAGKSKAPIWKASFDRAIIEMAWQQLMEERKYGAAAFATVPPPIDPYELGRWLFSPMHWLRLTWWAWKLRWALIGAERDKWDSWRSDWHPWS